MRILFFGSGAFGLPTLRWLHAHHELAAVVSQPDRPAGRKRKLTPTPVSEWALANSIELLREEDVNTPEFVAKVAGYQAGASVVIAFGQKLSPQLIDAMGQLAVNLHASLLPAYRGAAPINRAMMDNLNATGVSVIELAQRMDAGAVYATASTPIDPGETAGELHDRLSELGPEAVGSVLNDLENQTLKPVEQDETLATRAAKLSKPEGTTSFDQPADQVRARVHGLTPWPGCRVKWTVKGAGDSRDLFLRRVSDEDGVTDQLPGTVLDAEGRVACAKGVLRLLELQAPGGKPMDLNSFVRGQGLGPGDRLEPFEA